MDVLARPAVEVLAEALGEPRRRIAACGGARVASAGWDCGCRIRTAADELRVWDSCADHLGFREAVMARLAVVTGRNA